MLIDQTQSNYVRDSRPEFDRTVRAELVSRSAEGTAGRSLG